MALVEWTRPAGFLALLLPLAVWLLALRRERPAPEPTGAIALWRPLASKGSGGSRWRRLPPATRALLGALILGTLGLAGPRRAAAAEARSWQVIVDRSPSMYLAHTDAEGRPSGRGTRLDASLASLEEWRAQAARGDTLHWIAPGEADGVTHPGDSAPTAWRSAPAQARERPRFLRWRGSRCLWVSDRIEGAELSLASGVGGVFAAGGGPVPGAVSGWGAERLVWDGDGVRTSVLPGAAQPRVLRVGSLAPLLEELLVLWAEERRVRVVDSDGAGTILRIVGAEAADVALETGAACGRDGWSTRATLASAPLASAAGALDVWLTARGADGNERPVVTWRPGEVHVGLVSLAPPAGEAAAFAVSWAELFDAACLPPGDVVPLAQRRGVVASARRIARPAASHGAPRAAGAGELPLAALLCAAASLLALASLVLPGGALRGARG